jgi:alpha-L-rhamnosidase
MNSFNHYSYGAVAAWMIRGSLGIKRLEDAPGFSEFVLCPVPDPTGLMKSAKGYLDTVSGRIESSWEITEDAIIYRFKIPANTGAIFFHAGKNEVEHLTSGEYVFKDNK